MEGPEPGEPDGVGIGDAFEVFTGHGQVGEVLEAEVGGTVSQRIHVHIRHRRRRWRWVRLRHSSEAYCSKRFRNPIPQKITTYSYYYLL